jgi:hypothetical protein
MSQPVIAASAPTSFLRRAFDWWLAQVKHALPPTIFFFVGFNLILWTKRLILEEHGNASGAARRKSGSGDRQPVLHAPFR